METRPEYRRPNSYYESLSAAMAVYTDLRQEYGHWGEVRPPENPAAQFRTAGKIYVVPLPHGDAKLAELAAGGVASLFAREARLLLLFLFQFEMRLDLAIEFAVRALGHPAFE